MIHLIDHISSTYLLIVIRKSALSISFEDRPPLLEMIEMDTDYQVYRPGENTYNNFSSPILPKTWNHRRACKHLHYVQLKNFLWYRIHLFSNYQSLNLTDMTYTPSFLIIGWPCEGVLRFWVDDFLRKLAPERFGTDLLIESCKVSAKISTFLLNKGMKKV